MNVEHLPVITSDEHADSVVAEQGTELVVRPAQEHDEPDWRRFQVATRRHIDIIEPGINKAMAEHRLVDPTTARHMAHTLSRSLPPGSALADYAETGAGDYQQLRDEYLSLFQHKTATSTGQALVRWFGTYLTHQAFPEAVTIDRDTPTTPELDRLLVPTTITLTDEPVTIHLPATLDSQAIQEFRDYLVEFDFNTDPGRSLLAYLSLPHVNAQNPNTLYDCETKFIGTWPDLDDALAAVYHLDDREEEIRDFAAERRLYFDYLEPDYDALMRDAERDIDITEHQGAVYVFDK